MTASTGKPSDPQLVLITPSGEAGPALGAASPGAGGSGESIAVFRTARHFLSDDASHGSGCILLPAETGTDELRLLLRELADREGPWTPVLVEVEDGSPRAVPLSLGYPEPLEALLGRLGVGDDEAVERLPLLELRSVLKEVSRARHDINNPLTAALAETQLLLLDIEEGEVRDAVETVEHQLRRIRDLVARLSSVRAPKTGHGTTAIS
jgi:signal transduction histidine kinase